MLLCCHDSLYRYARALSRDPSVAEDLVQETFQRALAAKRYPHPLTAASVRPWAFTILRNVWLNAMREAERDLNGQLTACEIADPRGEPMEAQLTR